MNTIDKLDYLADLKAQADVARMDYDNLRNELIPPNVRAALVEAEAVYQEMIKILTRDIANLETEIKAEVIQGGATVKGAHLQAVYNKGRVSWDTKALDGYAAGHPEIMPFRKVGEPSVSIR